jgi:hypothetical protein
LKLGVLIYGLYFIDAHLIKYNNICIIYNKDILTTNLINKKPNQVVRSNKENEAQISRLSGGLR